jgi:hypothetical protein
MSQLFFCSFFTKSIQVISLLNFKIMMAIIFYYRPNNYAILVPEHRTFPFRSPFNDFTLLMNLQNKTSLEIVSLATVLIAVIGFIDYLFNFYFKTTYPWSLPVQLNSSVNLISFCLLLF